MIKFLLLLYEFVPKKLVLVCHIFQYKNAKLKMGVERPDRQLVHASDASGKPNTKGKKKKIIMS